MRIVLQKNESVEICHWDIDIIVHVECIEDAKGLTINMFKWEYKNEYKYLDDAIGVVDYPDLPFEEMNQKKIIHTEFYPALQEV